MLSVNYIILVLLYVTRFVHSWNTCADEVFCDRIRNQDAGSSQFVLDRYSLVIGTTVEANLTNTENQKILRLAVSILQDDVFRIRIVDPEEPRHSVQEALDGEPVLNQLYLVGASDDGDIWIENGQSSLYFYFDPFRLDIYVSGNLVTVINAQGRLTYNTEEDDKSIALDFTFPGATRAYGIPEHAERLSLQTTAPGGLNPYRLYNVDYPAYPIGTQEALYATVPVLYAHSTQRTSGIFWLNSAQTFVDINNGENQVESLFISETGIIDVFTLPGPTLEAAVKQYTNLTGPGPLPQYFAIAHHQCRWSYMSQEDAETVVREFDNHNFPLDVIWLDIDYTDSFKYFTWNYDTFPDPVGMQDFINSTGRKVVVIIDPHYKVEEGYFVFDIATAKDYFVKYANGTDFQGECWPGLSSYLDYHNPEGADWYSSLFAMDQFPDGTEILYVWNDMNEPSVFDVPEYENTMPRYLVHYGGWEHRDVHNMYGFTQHVATHNGLLLRYSNQKRPFVLTRSFFAGSQRSTAVWTGDNVASWEHLRISFPMLLTISLSGISFCGADVGGFDGNVEEELLQRWYQAGAWLPFFRAHSSMYTERREPYLFPEDVQARIRAALRDRYDHLPMWYTLWFEHEYYLSPVIRPLSYHYPSDSITLDMDDQWLVGSDILVHPVTEEGASQVQVYLPGGFNEFWYDIRTNLLYIGAGYVTVNDITLDYTPVFYRGGSIIARRNTDRLASVHTHDDPLNLYAFLNSSAQASGSFYFDDYESFDYRSNVYNYWRFEFNNEVFSAYVIHENAYYTGIVSLGGLTVYRPVNVGIRTAIVNSGKTRKEFAVSYGPDNSFMYVDNLNVPVNKDLKIQFI